ncbi:MAG: adenylyltransferase/cytidyltransferase family protein [Candidatus Doudnabacteria bacterium]|nr:adenylyltransferase/cytidyltransferase family protein [Candidatus Doudnabacteria bacterium]
MKKAKHKRSPVVKTKSSTTRVMVFGVFDLLHPGHISFLRQARRLGDYLVVSVARDVNVRKFKGYKASQNERQRTAIIKKLKFVNKVVLGGLKNPWPHIKKEKPDIIALGYDQNPYVKITELKKISKVVRLEPYKHDRYHTSILRRIVVSGEVARHLGRGRRLGYPTANLDTKTNLDEGIYLGLVNKIEGGMLPPLFLRKLLPRKHLFTPPVSPPLKGGMRGGLPSLIFIGKAETFNETRKLVEVHILDFNHEIYGCELEVEVIKKIRENEKFLSKEELVEQMKNDELVARQFFSSYNQSN